MSRVWKGIYPDQFFDHTVLVSNAKTMKNLIEPKVDACSFQNVSILRELGGQAQDAELRVTVTDVRVEGHYGLRNDGEVEVVENVIVKIKDLSGTATLRGQNVPALQFRNMVPGSSYRVWGMSVVKTFANATELRCTPASGFSPVSLGWPFGLTPKKWEAGKHEHLLAMVEHVEEGLCTLSHALPNPKFKGQVITSHKLQAGKCYRFRSAFVLLAAELYVLYDATSSDVEFVASSTYSEARYLVKAILRHKDLTQLL